MTFEIPTGEMEMELHLTLEAKEPCVLRIIGYDATQPHTIYFRRGYGYRINNPRKLFHGTHTFVFPLVISPKVLSLKILNDLEFNNVRLVSVEARPHKRSEMWLRPEEIDFIHFALEFSQNAGAIAPDTYLSDYENYIVKYLPVLKNRETGIPVTTPARVNRRTGIIEVARKKFLKYTVFMRIIILLHEFFHWELDTRSEEKADFHAIGLALDLGIPETEIMYAFTKVFPKNNEALKGREVANINFIKNYKMMKSLKNAINV